MPLESDILQQRYREMDRIDARFASQTAAQTDQTIHLNEPTTLMCPTPPPVSDVTTTPTTPPSVVSDGLGERMTTTGVRRDPGPLPGGSLAPDGGDDTGMQLMNIGV